MNKSKKKVLDFCVEELNKHITKLKEKFGKFQYATMKEQYDPDKEEEMLKMMLPNVSIEQFLNYH